VLEIVMLATWDDKEVERTLNKASERLEVVVEIHLRAFKDDNVGACRRDLTTSIVQRGSYAMAIYEVVSPSIDTEYILSGYGRLSPTKYISNSA
jgi:hypothetical protein